MSASATTLVEHTFRHQAGRLIARLARVLGLSHLDLAEECVQEALLRALQSWPYSGVPENPEGWLYRVAHNAAIDAVRSRRVAREKMAELAHSASRHQPAETGGLDDELRLIFMCCHPDLSREVRVALSLNIAGGFSAREIARAFLKDEAATAQMLVRAKRQIRDRGLKLELPGGAALAERIDSVLDVLYLMFNEGYVAREGQSLIRQDVCHEALRLARLVAVSEASAPRVHALAALLAFQAARLPARVDEGGELVPLESQNRDLWDRALIGLGFAHFDASIGGPEISRYHVEAAIAATYARAAGGEPVDWATILHLYDQLATLNASAVVRLNRAVVVGKVYGAEAALAEIDRLKDDPQMRGYYLLPATRGHLLLDSGRASDAAECFRAALNLPCSEPERRFLKRMLARCE